ncbi:MAG: efflux RND transporter periplasmic adaptor subunit [Caulobacterales bacterium]
MADGTPTLAQTAQAPAPPRMVFGVPVTRRSIILGVAIAAVLAVLALSGQWLTFGRFQQSTDNAYVRADISPVSPQVQGIVRQVLVSDNDAVAAGQPLALIEDADFLAKLAKAKADLAAARANLIGRQASARGAGEQVGQQGAQIDRAQAALAAAQADRAKLAADRQRYQTLFDKGLVAEARLQSIDADARRAAAVEQAAAAELAWQSGQRDVLSSSRARAGGDVSASVAAVQAAQAALAAAQLDLDRTVLRAPIAGIVGARTIESGQLARPGQQAMAIVPLDKVYVVANFKETQLARMAPGQKVTVKVDGLGGRAFTGALASLAPASGSQFAIVPTDTATGNFTKIVQRVPVKIQLDMAPADQGKLRPGMSVTAIIDTRAAR